MVHKKKRRGRNILPRRFYTLNLYFLVMHTAFAVYVAV